MVKERSFWSTTSGVVTGVAGTLTGVVGVATVAAQLGWIGPAENDSRAAQEADAAGTTSSTMAWSDDRRSGGDDRAARRDTTSAPSFTVDPSSLSFEALGQHTSAVMLRNTGSVELDVEGISVDGDDSGRFAVSGAPCTQGSILPGRSCEIEVSFNPQGSGDLNARMVIEVQDASAREVALSGSSLL